MIFEAFWLPINNFLPLFLILHMPNKWNISIEFYYILWSLFPIYVLVFPQLYFHMFKQRAKALGGKSRAEKNRAQMSSVNPMRNKDD